MEATLTAEQAGTVLGVSSSRVRQLMRQGLLDGTAGPDGRLWFDHDQVAQLARDRNTGKIRVARGAGAQAEASDLEAVLTRVLNTVLPKAVEAAVADLRRDLDKERAARLRAERELARLRQRNS